VATFAEVAQHSGWSFGQVILLGPEFPACNDLAERLGAPLVTPPPWIRQYARSSWGCGRYRRIAPGTVSSPKLTSQSIGLILALEHPAEHPEPATTDVVGVLADAGKRRARAPNPVQAMRDAAHPGARLAGRRLRPQ
jgi:hypothetical protein